MQRVGGSRTVTGRRRSSRSALGGSATALGAAVLLALSVALPTWADGETDPTGEASQSGDQGEGGGTDAGAGDGTDAGAGDGSGTEAVAAEGDAQGDAGVTEGADEGDDQETEAEGATTPTQRTGTAYGGRATGPAPLITLPDDPAYPVPAPPVNESLPEEVDEGPSWQENIVCDPVERPGIEAFGNLIGAHYERPGYGTARACIDQKSEHYDGRAIDWQLDAHDPQDRRIGDATVTWLTDNDGEMAKRFGIQSIIWNERVWRSYEDIGWRGYVGQSAHTDHVHFSFTWDGAAMRTSWWTGVAVETPDLGPCRVLAGQYAAIPQAPRFEPCPTDQLLAPQTGYFNVRPGSTGGGVGLLQPLLEVEQTGVLDATTREALIAWQGEQGVPVTGVLDQMTYAAALGWEMPELPEAAWAVEQPDHMVTAFTPYKRAELAEDEGQAGAVLPEDEGEAGAVLAEDEGEPGAVLDAAYEAEAVAVLQEALGVEPDGVFGPKTAAALEEFTTAHPLLTPSTATTPLTWQLLEQRAHPTLAYRDRVLETGDSGLDVAVLQEQLDVEPDGVFGPVTEQAVLDAQVAAELEPTGLVDAMTWAATDKGEGTGLVDGTGMEDDEPGFTMIDGVIVPSLGDELSQSDQPVEDD